VARPGGTASLPPLIRMRFHRRVGRAQFLSRTPIASPSLIMNGLPIWPEWRWPERRVTKPRLPARLASEARTCAISDVRSLPVSGRPLAQRPWVRDQDTTVAWRGVGLPSSRRGSCPPLPWRRPPLQNDLLPLTAREWPFPAARPIPLVTSGEAHGGLQRGPHGGGRRPPSGIEDHPVWSPGRPRRNADTGGDSWVSSGLPRASPRFARS
jgi:hypothetical protein